MLSGSKIFSYAGQRIALVCMGPKVYERKYEFFEKFYEMPAFGDAYIFGVLYCASSGTSHSGVQLQQELIRYGVSSISLVSTGSEQEGIRACVSMISDDEAFARLERFLKKFNEDHKK